MKIITRIIREWRVLRYSFAMGMSGEAPSQVDVDTIAKIRNGEL